MRRHRRVIPRLIGAVILLAISTASLFALLGPAGEASARPSRSPRSSLRWAMARSSLEHLDSADASQAQRSLDGPGTLVQNDPPLASDPTPAGWRATATERWGSYARFAADVAAGSVPSYVSVVHYDNESWSQTPPGEQLHPAVYERKFCSLAHRNGWRCYTGPGQDLCGALTHPAGETYARCYLDLDLAGEAARYADVIDIQAQALEPAGARAYGNFVRRAAAQARAANPNVVVLGNLSPSPNGTAVPARRLYSCAKAALPHASGFYTTVAAGEGAEMVKVLRLLD
jgi:hypothetical protein